MQGMHAAILCLLAALALSGCASRSGPVATGQPQGDLDSLAYGPAPRVAIASSSGAADSGGAIAALRASFAGPAPHYYAPAAYAAAPMPATYDAGYRLDAGDKLRVVVFGQEGLTNTYAIDAGGAIPIPLIGSVAG